MYIIETNDPVNGIQYSIVEDEFVCGSKEKHKTEDTVNFEYKQEMYKGVVKEISDEDKVINKRYKILVAQLTMSKRKLQELDSSTIPAKKKATANKPPVPKGKALTRSGNLRRSTATGTSQNEVEFEDSVSNDDSDTLELASSSLPNQSKERKALRNISNIKTTSESSESETENGSDGSKQESEESEYEEPRDENPSKKEKKLLSKKTNNAATNRGQQNTNSNLWDGILDLDGFEAVGDDESQLFGEENGSVNVGKSNIFCKEKQFSYALSATTGSSVIRRLIPGIFNQRAIEECTRTGFSKEDNSIGKPLHSKARKVIFAFASFIQKNDSKVKESTDKELKVAFTQKVSELKGRIKIAKEQNKDVLWR